MRCYVCSASDANFSKTQLQKSNPVCKSCTTSPHKCDGCGWTAQFSNFKFFDQQTKRARVQCKRCEESDKEPMFCFYDGPHDPDRYEGHGEYDVSDGYYVG